MPELPEVEVVKRSLKSLMLNKTIRYFVIKNSKLRYKIDHKQFSNIKNVKVKSISRKSKYLIISLSNNLCVLIHLGMTGKFFFVKKNDLKKLSFYYNKNDYIKKHDHLIMVLRNNNKVVYNDVRKFGFIKIIEKNHLFKSKHLKNLGPEPLTKKFNLGYSLGYFKNRNLNIKNCLMSQSFISGIGNIYANEILFKSKIIPTKAVKELKKHKVKNLIIATKKILKSSIEKGGSSIQNFKSANGMEGTFQDNFKVYNREGLKCSRINCYAIIKKQIIGQRSTFFCPKCQK